MEQYGKINAVYNSGFKELLKSTKYIPMEKPKITEEQRKRNFENLVIAQKNLEAVLTKIGKEIGTNLYLELGNSIREHTAALTRQITKGVEDR